MWIISASGDGRMTGSEAAKTTQCTAFTLTSESWPVNEKRGSEVQQSLAIREPYAPGGVAARRLVLEPCGPVFLAQVRLEGHEQLDVILDDALNVGEKPASEGVALRIEKQSRLRRLRAAIKKTLAALGAGWRVKGEGNEATSAPSPSSLHPPPRAPRSHFDRRS